MTSRLPGDCPEPTRTVTPKGIYVRVVGDGKIVLVLVLGPLYRIFVKKKFRLVMLKANKDLEYLNRQYTEGKLRPVIHGPFELEEIRRVFEIFAAGNHKGKLVIEVIKP